LDTKTAKNSINLSESEIKALLQLIFELGIQYDKVSSYNLISYAKKYYNSLSSKKGVQLHFFLQTIITLEEDKWYKPNQLNKLASDNFRNSVPKLLNDFGLITNDQLYSIKNDGNLISPRELTELLQIMKDDLKILEKRVGIKSIKDKQNVQPGRKNKKELINYEGFPSHYKLSDEFISIKNLFRKSEFQLYFKNFIIENHLIKNYLIFTLDTILYNSSKLINIKIKPEYKERLNGLIKNKNLKEEKIIEGMLLLLLFGSKEIKNFSNILLDEILYSNNYTYILFLIKLSSFINKLKMKKSKLKIVV